MELLALVIFNIVFGLILYFIISIKVTESMKDYQNQKLKKEIQSHTIQFFKESENYLALMDARITILKNLIHRAENLGIDFNDKLINEEESIIPEVQYPSKEKKIDRESTKQKTTITPKEIREFKKIEIQESPSESGLLGSIGKMFRSFMGADDLVVQETRMPVIQTSKSTQQKHIDMSVGGNPFEEEESVEIINHVANSEGEEFANYLSRTLKPSPTVPSDKAMISISAALSELPENTSKVDKVVFLLRRGYGYSEISEELGLAIPEISLIETIKMERNRRV